MFIRQLVYLSALARERHFAKAAMACNVSQPTLSAGIRNLETELNVPIVRRGHRFLGFTPEGERVLLWAQQILADFEGLRQDLSTTRTGLAGRLRLGVIPAALPAVTTVTEPFLDHHPQVGIDVSSMTSREIQAALERFEIDLGITYLDNEPLRHVRSVPLYRERYLFATRDPHWADRPSVTWSEAARSPLCLLSPAMQNRRIIDAALREAGAVAEPRVEADTHLVLITFVRTGRWSTILPDSWAGVLSGIPEIRLLPLVSPERSQQIGLVLFDRDPLPPLAQALVSLLGRLELPWPGIGSTAATTAPA